MTPEEENKLYELSKKQRLVALDARELKEFIRLSHKKAKETAALNRQKPSG